MRLKFHPPEVDDPWVAPISRASPRALLMGANDFLKSPISYAFAPLIGATQVDQINFDTCAIGPGTILITSPGLLLKLCHASLSDIPQT